MRSLIENETKSKDPKIAKTILKQLGGNRFFAMTGAKNLVDHGNGVSFKVGRIPAGKSNYMKITLDHGSDTYDVQFGYARGYNFRVKKELGGVHAGQLRSLFTQYTGLDTSL